jgi:Predicted metalloprotease
MRWQGRRESDNVEDRRDQQQSGYGGRQIRLPRGKGGLVILVLVAIAGYYGYDLTPLLTGGESVAPQTQQQPRQSAQGQDEAAKFTRVILASTEDTWSQLFEKMGRHYVAPNAGDVPWFHHHQLRHRPDRDGPVLLPGGSKSLYRPLFLR